MQSKFAVLTISSLLCCIPAVVFFMFRDKSDSLGTYTPAATVWPIVQQDEHYKATLESAVMPLKRGKQLLNLHLEKLSQEKLVSSTPVVQVVMPMGKDTMTAPATLKKLAQPGEYQIQTDFAMAGKWELQVKPQPAAKEIALDFQVQM